MPKYQLTMSPGYVDDWTYIEAVRELFQNAIDNQTIDPENKMFLDYNGDTLLIGNKTSILTVDTLLLGSSSKRNNEDTIGRHGEGYKVAMMVLLRGGKGMTIYNYGNRQVWGTRLYKSRKYNNALIPEVNVDDKYLWKKKPKHNLIIEVTGITQEEYARIVETNLHLQEVQEGYESSNGMGRILTDPKHKGRIYVNGLFVAYNKEFHYGYSIHPKYLPLDRDRRVLDTIDISFVTSKMWRYSGQEELVAKLMMNDIWDTKWIKDMRDYREPTNEQEIDRKITKSLRKEFVAEHGEKSVPVSDNKELQRISRVGGGVKAAMVSRGVSAYLKEDAETPSVMLIPTKDRLRSWFDTVEHKLSDEEKDEFNALMDDLE